MAQRGRKVANGELPVEVKELIENEGWILAPEPTSAGVRILYRKKDSDRLFFDPDWDPISLGKARALSNSRPATPSR